MNACNPGCEEIEQFEKKEFTLFFYIFSLGKTPQYGEATKIIMMLEKVKRYNMGDCLL